MTTLHQQEIAEWAEFLGDGHLTNGPTRLRRDYPTDAVEQRGCMVGPIPKPGWHGVTYHISIHISDCQFLYIKASLKVLKCVEGAPGPLGASD